MKTRPSVSEKGLKKHLSDYGVNPADFANDVEENMALDGRPNIARLQRKYNFSRKTIKKWTDLYLSTRKPEGR